MFQTLVDVASRRLHIWRALLGEDYSEALARRYWALSEQVVLGCFERLSSTGEFFTVKQIFEMGFAQMFRQEGLAVDPRRAAEVAATEHARATPFEDALPFLEAAASIYPVCLVCDGDEDMLPSALMDGGHFDRVFLSERLRAYKQDPQGRLFAAVVAHYGVAPDRIVHIGDSVADVVGARRAGMHTYWLNRAGTVWALPDHPPDRVVASLPEAEEMLGVQRDTQ